MIDKIARLVNADAKLVRRGRFVDTTFMIAIDDADTLIRIQEGRVTKVTPGPFITPDYSFALRASRARLGKILAAAAAARLHRRVRAGQTETDAGGRRPPSVHGQPALFQGRARGAAQRNRKQAGRPMSPRFEPITGRYLHLDLLGKPHRLYVEEAGQGIPLLCLHTAGSDGRQYRGLMNDARVTANFRVIAFDMPWHGKSSPPAGWQDEEYQLTSRDYVRMIVEVADALGLDRPVAMGCSIGGRIVLHLAHEPSGAFPRADRIGIGAHTEPYYDLSWLNRPDVHGGMVCAGVVSGLVAPTAPVHGALGNAVALHAERARRVQGRPAFLHDRRAMATPVTNWPTSTSSAARCSC